ncbi:P-loop containing nucleoside triphosphate hydrolase protein [Irpex rosettiformis]|uniref:P-loop containing nucleoside triphosphate hydrolase protein n=1 Tax=Irpex rosettiformis TaxID=378272 RepID=A0ACB8TUL2_9APHY|nr:P-loop containing nucleoside triphosphate hydrolase protein [Irpex rosettiformis]
MDNIARELSEILADSFSKIPPTQRFIIGIAGVPASGKSTLAIKIVQYINEILQQRSPNEKENQAILVGMDGWHLTRAQLDAFPDAKLAHDRRGAHWTFDGDSYVSFIRDLRVPLDQTATYEDPVIYAPSFSHELKDPTPQAVAIYPHHRLVVIEGLYGFLSIEPWVEAGRLLDERWWVELGEEEAKARLVLRHVLTGVAKDLEEAEWRATENDAPNGRFIKENLLEPTRIIQSIEDPVLKAVAVKKQTE